jgi:hypothetical protein
MKEDLMKLRHARSVKDFPEIDLDEGEFVELAIRRSRKGLILIWAGEVVGFAALTLVLILLRNGDGSEWFGLNEAAMGYLYMVIFVLYGVLLIAGLVGTFVYKHNLLVVTNHRAIQRIRSNLLASSVNIIDLESIEDVSFHQSGVLDYLFHMGTIRLSTVGDETTYTFPFVDTPRDELKTIASLVHKAKDRKSAKRR